MRRIETPEFDRIIDDLIVETRTIIDIDEPTDEDWKHVTKVLNLLAQLEEERKRLTDFATVCIKMIDRVEAKAKALEYAKRFGVKLK